MSAVRASPAVMAQREIDLRALVDQGYTVLDAGRLLGLTTHQSEYIAQKCKIQALHGALSEAKSDAAIKGNQIRWGGKCCTITARQ